MAMVELKIRKVYNSSDPTTPVNVTITSNKPLAATESLSDYSASVEESSKTETELTTIKQEEISDEDFIRDVLAEPTAAEKAIADLDKIKDELINQNVTDIRFEQSGETIIATDIPHEAAIEVEAEEYSNEPLDSADSIERQSDIVDNVPNEIITEISNDTYLVEKQIKKVSFAKKDTKYDYSKTKIKNKFETTKSSKTQLQIARKKEIKEIFKIMSQPDFLKHQFDVMILFNNNDVQKYAKLYANVTSVAKVNVDKEPLNVLTARVSGIEIPLSKSETFSLKTLYLQMDKIRSHLETEKRASLKIRMDESLFYYQFFNLLSGNNESYMGLPRNLSPGSINQYLTTTMSNRRASVVVRAEDLSKTDNTRIKFLWVFEDVRFLGTDTDIEFSHESTNTTDFNMPFIFKRVYRVYS